MTKPGAIDTSIRTLGTPKLTSRLPYRTWVDDVRLPIQVDRELCDEFTEPVCLDFEAAGPRKKLYFDPSRAKCAIVTCGGLCPGLNDVIRAIVMEAHHAYHVPSIMGIRYGLEGFIPACGHQPMELTPERVADIHRFGGTILGSSRGPQSAEEIVDSLERSNVSILFVIGGDGSMKAALSISREVQARNLKIASPSASRPPSTRPPRPSNAPIPRPGACPTASAWSSSWAGNRASSPPRPRWP